MSALLTLLDNHVLERKLRLCQAALEAGPAAHQPDLRHFEHAAGTVTFKNNHHLREALSAIPRERILVETDAPFLTPMPYRGRPNASYMVPYTVRAMAEHLGADLGDLCARIAENTEVVYGSWVDDIGQGATS
jgi:TatD DNase family protein